MSAHPLSMGYAEVHSAGQGAPQHRHQSGVPHACGVHTRSDPLCVTTYVPTPSVCCAVPIQRAAVAPGRPEARAKQAQRLGADSIVWIPLAQVWSADTN